MPKILRREIDEVRKEVVHNSCARLICQVEAEVMLHLDVGLLQRRKEVDVHGLSQVATLKVVDGRAAFSNSFTHIDAKDVALLKTVFVLNCEANSSLSMLTVLLRRKYSASIWLPMRSGNSFSLN